MSGTKRAVFLDRDGVLNAAVVRDGKPYPPAGVGELDILPGVAEALDQLKAAGFVLVVVTNQPDVARGTTTRAAVDAINARLVTQLAVLDGLAACFHDDGDGCNCRKPLPGMLHDAARAMELDVARSFMVGDRWRDIAAGAAAGCRTVFIDRGYSEARPESPDAIVADLPAAAVWILAQR